MIRINVSNNKIEYSTNRGLSWISRNLSSQAKTFVAIQDAGRELIAQTNDGHIYYSTNEGLSWIRRR
ncbi:MAG: hypothetical protein J6Y88_07915 [Bacteroidales bacterium]|nr:hypothetical protein [Bacteroidales bacterium]